jgi:hypothetical protein
MSWVVLKPHGDNSARLNARRAKSKPMSRPIKVPDRFSPAKREGEPMRAGGGHSFQLLQH